jgi:hypothetical protein
MTSAIRFHRGSYYWFSLGEKMKVGPNFETLEMALIANDLACSNLDRLPEHIAREDWTFSKKFAREMLETIDREDIEQYLGETYKSELWEIYKGVWKSGEVKLL